MKLSQLRSTNSQVPNHIITRVSQWTNRSLLNRQTNDKFSDLSSNYANAGRGRRERSLHTERCSCSAFCYDGTAYRSVTNVQLINRRTIFDSWLRNVATFRDNSNFLFRGLVWRQNKVSGRDGRLKPVAGNANRPKVAKIFEFLKLLETCAFVGLRACCSSVLLPFPRLVNQKRFIGVS